MRDKRLIDMRTTDIGLGTRERETELEVIMMLKPTPATAAFDGLPARYIYLLREGVGGGVGSNLTVWPGWLKMKWLATS